MNEQQKYQIALDRSGLVEVCDRCGEYILDQRFARLAFLTFDGKIICNNCRTKAAKVVDIE